MAQENRLDVNMPNFNRNGVVEGVFYGQQERTKQLSDRMYTRNLPSSTLQAQYNPRPVSTKYATLPVVNPRKQAKVPIEVQPTYQTTQTFNPGNYAPWSGFASKIDDESKLRSQFFALQKCEQSEYVPSSTSDLYEVAVTSAPVHQPHPDLFAAPALAPFNPNPCGMGNKLMYNHTRQQVKDIGLIDLPQKTYKY